MKVYGKTESLQLGQGRQEKSELETDSTKMRRVMCFRNSGRVYSKFVPATHSLLVRQIGSFLIFFFIAFVDETPSCLSERQMLGISLEPWAIAAKISQRRLSFFGALYSCLVPV